MAESFIRLPDDGTGKATRTALNTIGSTPVHQEVVTLGDADGTLATPSAFARDVSLGSLTETAPATDTASAGINGRLQRAAQRLTSLIGKIPDQEGTWGYNAGTSGTLTLTGSKRVLSITAIALGSAGSFTINGGDTISLPYDSTDKAASALTIKPMANLVDPTIIFTSTDGYFVEYVV